MGYQNNKPSQITFLKFLCLSSKYGCLEFQNYKSNQTFYIPLKNINSDPNISEIQVEDEVYFLPVTKIGENHEPFEVLSLWVHLPFNGKENGEETTFNKIREFALKPSCAVNAKDGIDLYWRLRKDPGTGFPSIKEARPYLEKITSYFGVFTNIDQFLRLPKDYQIWEGHEYDLSDFDFSMEPQGEPLEGENTDIGDIQDDNPIEEIEAQEESHEPKLKVIPVENPLPSSPQHNPQPHKEDSAYSFPLIKPIAESDNQGKGANPQVEDDNYKFNFSEGAFVTSRSLFKSEVWEKDPIYLKVWIWMLGRANHKDIKKGDFIYHRGEFSTWYGEISEALSYKSYKNHKRFTLSKQQIRDIIDWFVNQGMIGKTPIAKPISPKLPKSSQSQGVEKAREGTYPKTPPKTYLGLKIKIINYDTYQSLENYKNIPINGHKNTGGKKDENTGRTQVEHDNNNDRKRTNTGRSKKKETDPRVLEFINYWEETFKQETGKPYLTNYGKDGDLVKKMFQAGHSLEDIQYYAKTAFKDEQCKRRGLTIGIFSQELNRLVGLKAMNPLEQARRELRKGN